MERATRSIPIVFLYVSNAVIVGKKKVVNWVKFQERNKEIKEK